MAADAIRAYLATLRERRQISQQKMADLIGVTRVAWQKYEQGKTKDPGHDLVLSALRHLLGTFADLQRLSAPSATADLGKRLAEARAAHIAAVGELEALRDTMGREEYQAYLDSEEATFQRKMDAARRASQLSPDELRNGHGQ